MNPSTALRMGRGCTLPPFHFSTMFNFSANHLFLLSRKEYRSWAVLLLLDRDTQRVYRLHDFAKTHHLGPG